MPRGTFRLTVLTLIDTRTHARREQRYGYAEWRQSSSLHFYRFHRCKDSDFFLNLQTETHILDPTIKEPASRCDHRFSIMVVKFKFIFSLANSC